MDIPINFAIFANVVVESYLKVSMSLLLFLEVRSVSLGAIVHARHGDGGLQDVRADKSGISAVTPRLISWRGCGVPRLSRCPEFVVMHALVGPLFQVTPKGKPLRLAWIWAP